MTKALILIDFQNEWVDKTSDNYVGELSNLITKANKLIKFARKNNFKIIWTRHIEQEPGYGFNEGTVGSEINSSLDFQLDDNVIVKHKISPFYKTNMKAHLEGIDEVTVCGLLTNLCVRSFVQDAYDRDFGITIIKDCCATYTTETHEFTLRDLKETRSEIEVLEVEDFVSVNN